MNSTVHCPLCEVTIFDTRKVSEAGRASAKYMNHIYSMYTFYGVSPTVFMYEYLTQWTVSNTAFLYEYPTVDNIQQYWYTSTSHNGQYSTNNFM